MVLSTVLPVTLKTVSTLREVLIGYCLCHSNEEGMYALFAKRVPTSFVLPLHTVLV